jgi:ribosomal protein S12 methylthiotransferase accessory factor
MDVHLASAFSSLSPQDIQPAIRSTDSAQLQPGYWTFPPTHKYSVIGVVRSVQPSETIRRARAVMSQAGISKVADVTGLDSVGIPNFLSVRPIDGVSGISYYNGKGTTRSDAHAGALMEAIERHAGECWAGDIRVSSYRELRGSTRCVRPDDLIIPSVAKYHDDLVLEWVEGFDLITRSSYLIPLNCIICPYAHRSYPTLFFSSSNGLASGNSLQEALCHALCEIIERDAQALAMARSQLSPAVRRLLLEGDSTTGIEPRVISQRGLPPRARRLLDKLHRAQLSVQLRDLTPAGGIATIDCTIFQTDNSGPAQAYGGCGCHPDARVALLRAITEAAQSRVTCIQGGREDLPDILSRCAHIDGPKSQATENVMVDFAEIGTYQHSDITEDLNTVLSALPRLGLQHAIAFDMTRPEVGIPVVRVVVPRAESWTVFQVHTGRATIGPRVIDLL